MHTDALNTDPESCPPEVKPRPMKTIYTMHTGFISCAGGDQEMGTARCIYAPHAENAVRANLGRSMCVRTIIDPIVSAQFNVKIGCYITPLGHYTILVIKEKF